MEKEKNKIVTIIGVITLLLIVIGATYAYFTAQIGEGTNTDINIQAYTTDSLTFESTEDITINVNQQNFALGMENQSGEATLKAILKANNTTNEAHYTYNVYLDIYNNTFEYSQKDIYEAELLLQVEGPDGPLDKIEGLTKTTSKGIEGFDITTMRGPIEIKTDQKIDATIETAGEATQEWKFTVIFINLDEDQNYNSGKKLNAKLTIQSEKRNYVMLETTTIDDYYYDMVCTSEDNMKTCKSKMDAAREEDYNSFKGRCYSGYSENDCQNLFISYIMDEYRYEFFRKTYRSGKYKDNIKSITFVNYIDENYKDKLYWDLSTNQDESIIGWMEETGEVEDSCTPSEFTECKFYDLYIGSKEKMYIDNLIYAFAEMYNLESIDFGKDIIDTSLVNDMSYMFYRNNRRADGKLILKGLENLDTSNVTNMSYMFDNAPISDLSAISGWDTSQLIYMNGIFSGITVDNLDSIINWDTSNVTSMSNMFSYAKISNMDSLKDLDTSKVTNMSGMFRGAKVNNLEFLKEWNIANVTDMSYLFSNTQIDNYDAISELDMSNVIDMSWMFEASSISDLTPIKNWNVSKVTDMSGMFYDCENLSVVNLNDWNTSNVTNMSEMFSNCSSLSSIDLNGWNTSKVTNMYGMFKSSSVSDLTFISSLNTSNVTNMSYMFAYSKISDLSPLNNLNTSNVTNMSYMFYESNNLNDVKLSNWNTSNVTDMSYMFSKTGITDVTSIKNWDVSKVTTMSDMFSECSNLTTLDLSGWETSSVTRVWDMFEKDSLLTDLRINKFNFNNVNSYYFMFGQHNVNLIITTNEDAKDWLMKNNDDLMGYADVLLTDENFNVV